MEPPVEILAGRYRLTSLLGKGGMGSVWRAEHTSLKTVVAVKLLDPRLAENESIRTRFQREAQAAAALRSKHVVQIVDHGVEGGVPYIVMELLRGESLASRLFREKVIEPRIFSRIFAEIGRAVARAHKAGIIHRDLKPDNVFLSEPEEETAHESSAEHRFVVKVLDFGIAKLLEDGFLDGSMSTETGAMLGTPHYMSPEQARGLKSIDARADLWSMAVIAFQCLTGKRPFDATAIGELVLCICSDAAPVPSSLHAVPAGFDAWFHKATQKNIQERFQTVAELVTSLEQILTPGTSHFEVVATTPAPWAGRPSAPEDPAFASTVPAGVAAIEAGPTSASLATTLEKPAAMLEDTVSGRARASKLRRGRRSMVAITLAALAVVGLGAAGLAMQTSPAKDFELVVHSTPPGATLVRGTKRVGSADQPVRLPWTSEALELSVESEGYEPKVLVIQPAPHVDVDVTLKRAAK